MLILIDLEDYVLPLILKCVVAFILKCVCLIITKVLVTEEIVFTFYFDEGL